VKGALKVLKLVKDKRGETVHFGETKAEDSSWQGFITELQVTSRRFHISSSRMAVGHFQSLAVGDF